MRPSDDSSLLLGSPPLPVGDAGTLYALHGKTVARWALRLGAAEASVPDILQTVFERVHRELPGFRGDAKLTTWLFRMTRNAVRQRERADRFRNWLKGSAEDAAGLLPDSATPEHSLEQAESDARVRRILRQMKERERTVLVLFELEELSGQEIAEMMGASVNTVWVWLHRARKEFLRRLQETEEVSG